MPAVELQSAKYLAAAPGYSEDQPNTAKPKGFFRKLTAFVFQATLVLGLFAAVFWFWLNQNQIQSNVQEQSGPVMTYVNSAWERVTGNRTNQFSDDTVAAKEQTAQ